MAPRISVFSIAMGADYSFYVKTIETHVRAFLALNILAICSVPYLSQILFLNKDFDCSLEPDSMNGNKPEKGKISEKKLYFVNHFLVLICCL